MAAVWWKVQCKAAFVFCNVDYTQISSHPTAVRVLRDAEKVERKTSTDARIMHSKNDKDPLCREHIFNFIQQQNAMYNLNELP